MNSKYKLCVGQTYKEEDKEDRSITYYTVLKYDSEKEVFACLVTCLYDFRKTNKKEILLDSINHMFVDCSIIPQLRLVDKEKVQEVINIVTTDFKLALLNNTSDHPHLDLI